MKKLFYKLTTTFALLTCLVLLGTHSVSADNQKGLESNDRGTADDFKCDNRDHMHIREMKERSGGLHQPIVYYILCTDASSATAKESPLGSIKQPDALSSFGVGEAGIARFIRVIIGILVVAATVLAFVYLIIGGIGFITAGGDKAKVESARGKIVWAVVGLVVVLAAFAIIRFVETIFGVSIISGTFDIPGV